VPNEDQRRIGKVFVRHPFRLYAASDGAQPCQRRCKGTSVVQPSRLSNHAGRPGSALTPVLRAATVSLGERENRPPRFRQSRAPRLVAAWDAAFPLPLGEGQGEGERDAANQNGRTNSASSARPFPRANRLCYPKTNFPPRFKNYWRKQASALVFRALPWGEGEHPPGS
jgi:hypothetical protein